ncbi:hypothetical protein C1H46_000699 [Malus baccata]|uniref:Uncharacterized protein n=1 Tax=Malus baccata TaxID=106549 RepID=A0A540NRN7_MALBA|nr:hypothetical protein C1H46_000699 [Malus baccata]
MGLVGRAPEGLASKGSAPRVQILNEHTLMWVCEDGEENYRALKSELRKEESGGEEAELRV